MSWLNYGLILSKPCLWNYWSVYYMIKRSKSKANSPQDHDLGIASAMQDCLSYKNTLRFRLKFEIAAAYFLNIPPYLESM